MIVGPELSVRQASWEDVNDLFEWRNDPVTQSMSLTKGSVERADHERWLRMVLADPSRLLLIIEAGAKSDRLGVVRFDVSGDEALVSLNLNPAYRGRGLAARLLGAAETFALGFFTEREVLRIRAEIMPENEASIRTFERAGYRKSSSSGPQLLIFTRLVVLGKDIIGGKKRSADR